MTPISEVYNCDCMEYMRTMPDKFFDLAIVDPPYGIKGLSKSGHLKKHGQLETVNDYKPDEAYFKELFRVSKNQIIWGYNHLSDMLPSCTEFIFWYKHNPFKEFSDGELAWTSFDKTAKCFDFPYYGNHNADKHRIHPTQKPVKLYNWLIDKYIGGGRKILDTHVGSGSSRIAAYFAGVDFYGCELDKEYFDKQQKRFEEECLHQITNPVTGQVIIEQELFNM